MATVDIHGGGPDLKFPHHENEIAQSEGAHGVKFANYWMHTGALNVDEEKMSKSLGNFFTVREALGAAAIFEGRNENRIGPPGGIRTHYPRLRRRISEFCKESTH